MGTKQRQRTPIPFGGGIDRSSGIMVVEPAAFTDLRNGHLRRGKFALRKGLLAGLELAGETDILAVASIRSQGLGAVITYNAGANEVRLYQVNGTGTSSSFIGIVWSLGVGADVPRIIADDSYDRLFICHDTPNANTRLTTKVYDLFAGTIADLTGDLDGTGVNPIKFRGVKRHLAYIFGWGFGTDSDPDRPEIVRVSMPADPMTFNPQHYFVAGQRADPVVGCAPAGRILAARKQSESYDIIGTDRATFAILPADLQFGQAGSRLSVTVGAINYFWGLEGPRQSAGGPTDDLAVLLDLAGPVPDALAADLDFDQGFAVYLPTAREVLFVFGSWAFVLHIEDQSQPRWSYREMHVDASCAGILYERSGVVALAEAILGTLSSVAPTYSGDPEPKLRVPWTTSGSLYGTEDVEIWVKSNYGGAGWVKLATVPATDLTHDQLVSHFLTDHTVAIRIVVGGVPGAAYFGTPDTWPATARGTINSGGVIDNFTLLQFDRSSNTTPGRLITWAGVGMGGTHPELTYVFEQDSGGGFTAVSGSPFTAVPARVNHTNGDVGITTFSYRLKAVGPDASSAFVTDGPRLLAPASPFGFTADPDAGGGAGHVHHCTAVYGEAVAGASLRFKARHLTAGTFTNEALITANVDYPSNAVDLDVPTDDTGDLELWVKTRLTAHGVTDESPYVSQDMGIL